MSFSNPDNAQHAEWAYMALQTFIDATRTDEGDALGDLLCNLMHYCREEDIDFLAHLNQGALHFQAEIEIEEEGDEADPSACAANPHHYRRHDGMAPPEPAQDDEDNDESVFDPESPEGRAVADGRMLKVESSAMLRISGDGKAHRVALSGVTLINAKCVSYWGTPSAVA